MKPAPQDHGLEGFKGFDVNSPLNVWIREFLQTEYERRLMGFWAEFTDQPFRGIKG